MIVLFLEEGIIVIQVRERAGRDGNGNFVGIACDEESPVAQVGSPVEDHDDSDENGDGAGEPGEEEVK